MPERETVPISGVWLRRIDPRIEVLVEIEKEWRLVIAELHDGQFSHIVETSGILKGDVDNA